MMQRCSGAGIGARKTNRLTPALQAGNKRLTNRTVVFPAYIPTLQGFGYGFKAFSGDILILNIPL